MVLFPVRTQTRLAILLAGCFLLAGPYCQCLDANDLAEKLFVRRIQPLLAEKCLACHGNEPKDVKGGLDLRTAETARKGGDSGQSAIVAGQPDKSPVYLSVQRSHGEWSAMPPKEADKLNDEQVRWLRDWIASDASWPTESRAKEIAVANAKFWTAEDGVRVSTSGGLSPDWTNRRYKLEGLWAYQPVRKPILEKEGAAAIDALLGQQLPAGLPVADEADARTLVRRATFDLTGLPPTPDEVVAFEAEFSRAADLAMKSLIDRLLASQQYGERMAQHWLDVTRYADSSGFANDFERGNAWRYRDYVVRSFNSDKPYDQFIREQIAGDEIDPNDPEKIIATGFLRMGPWELTGMEVPRIARQRFLDDVTNSVGETFLAHSLQCARCHDHKFDPIPTRDYYAVQAVFTTTQLSERKADFLAVENTSGFEERVYLEQSRTAFLQTLAQLDAMLLENANRWFCEHERDSSRWNEALETARNSNKGNKQGLRNLGYSDLFSQTRNALMRQGVAENELPPKQLGFTPEQFGIERTARKGLERLQWELDRYEPYALAVYDGLTPDVKSVFSPVRMPDDRLSRGDLEEGCIRLGGDPFSDGPKVSPGTLSILGSIPSAPIPATIEGRRKAFADWVASRENPLTTRTIVNRLWMWHFGEPLAGNPNNFGSTGKRPTHPLLLDWLAADFVEHRWSFKALHRTIMTSDAYRRSSHYPDRQLMAEKDPLGISYAVFRPRRLSAEELRDTMLAVTGELNLALGGIPNRPEMNLEAALQPRQVMGTFAAAWTPNPKPSQRNRRSLYALKLRGLSDPAMEVFNSPTPDFSCERRDASTVTPQVFSLFNGRASYARSLALAARVLKETRTDSEAIARCFALLFGRPPSRDELRQCLAHWQEMSRDQAMLTFVMEKPPLEVRRDAIEENTGERFSFVEKLPANADFVADLQAADCDVRTRALADVCLVLFNTNEFAYVD